MPLDKPIGPFSKIRKLLIKFAKFKSNIAIPYRSVA